MMIRSTDNSKHYVLGLVLSLVFALCARSSYAQIVTPDENAHAKPAASSPLAAKEKMVRDRLDRFRERLFDLRSKLRDTEPENAAKLTRALQRTGALGLSDELDEIIAMLDDPATLAGAVETQDQWVQKAEQLLDILLARDVENPQREEEMDRLETYKKEVSKLLERQRGMRDQSAKASVMRRMKRQFEQFRRRLGALAQKQGTLHGDKGSQQSGGPLSESDEKAEQQEDAAREAGDLAEDMKRASESAPSEQADSPEAQSARGKAGNASEATQEAVEAMEKAAEGMRQENAEQAVEADQVAREALERAKKEIERAIEELEAQSSTKGQAGDQREVAQDTQGLSQRLRGGDSPQGGEQPQGGEPQQGGEKQQGGPSPQQKPQQQPQPPPGLDNLDRAGEHMEDAAESLDQEEPEQATEKQERAIEALEQTQQELDEMLNQLRKEDRAEMLRGLEVRFRDLLGRQRVINADTDTLAETGNANFTRADRLQASELGERQRAAADRADSAEHILDEEGTTIVFPRVVSQLSDDMTSVAGRLSDAKIDALTQTMQGELVETLEQLLEAVKRMQQENEQQNGPQSNSDQEAPLLPTSAELKLLRSSQQRVNKRTAAIESLREGQDAEADSLSRETQEAAARQAECAEIARELYERKNHP